MAPRETKLATQNMEGFFGRHLFGKTIFEHYPAIDQILGEVNQQGFLAKGTQQADGTIVWVTTLPVDTIDQVRHFDRINEEAQKRVRIQIKQKVDAIRKKADSLRQTNDPELIKRAELLQNIVGPPTESFIFVVNGYPVITGWGFRPETGREQQTIFEVEEPVPESEKATQGFVFTDDDDDRVELENDLVEPAEPGPRFPWWLWLLIGLLVLLLLLLLLRSCATVPMLPGTEPAVVEQPGGKPERPAPARPPRGKNDRPQPGGGKKPPAQPPAGTTGPDKPPSGGAESGKPGPPAKPSPTAGSPAPPQPPPSPPSPPSPSAAPTPPNKPSDPIRVPAIHTLRERLIEGTKVLSLQPPDPNAQWRMYLDPAAPPEVLANKPAYLQFLGTTQWNRAKGSEVQIRFSAPKKGGAFVAEIVATTSSGSQVVYLCTVGEE